MMNPEILVAGTAPLPASGVLPLSRTLTGTFTATGKVVAGTGTLFSVELTDGDYLYSTSLNQVRRIAKVHDDLTLQLETAFSGAATAEAVMISRPLYSSISIIPTGVCTIDGVSLGATDSIINLNNGNIKPITYSGSVKFNVGYIR